VVACKLQYPDMASTVEADLRQLKLAMAVYHRMDGAIKQEDIYEELSERLRENWIPARGGADAPVRRDAARRDLVHIPRRAGLLHQAAADDDVARRQAADAAAGGGRRRRNATGSRSRCSAPGTCRSIATA